MFPGILNTQPSATRIWYAYLSSICRGLGSDTVQQQCVSFLTRRRMSSTPPAVTSKLSSLILPARNYLELKLLPSVYIPNSNSRWSIFFFICRARLRQCYFYPRPPQPRPKGLWGTTCQPQPVPCDISGPTQIPTSSWRKISRPPRSGRRKCRMPNKATKFLARIHSLRNIGCRVFRAPSLEAGTIDTLPIYLP